VQFTAVAVLVGVDDGVGVLLGVKVIDGVKVLVGVPVSVGVGVGVSDPVSVPVGDGLGGTVVGVADSNGGGGATVGGGRAVPATAKLTMTVRAVEDRTVIGPIGMVMMGAKLADT